MAIHKNFVPDYDATVVARLAAAGSILLGKLHMTEGATPRTSSRTAAAHQPLA
jgi:amidase